MPSMARKGTKPKSAPAGFQPKPGMRIVVLHGKEDYLHREYTQKLEEVLGHAFGEIQRIDFDGSTTELADVLDELRSYGLLQQHKLVVLNEADQFLAAGGEDKRNRKAMERYAEAPVEDATLLMRASTWRAGKIDKLITNHGAIVKCEAPPQDKAVTWCRQRVEARYDAIIERPAAEALIELIGVNLNRLDAELCKLATYVGPGQTIERSHISQLVGLTREQQAWTIQEALLTGHTGHAYTKLRELMEVSQAAPQQLMWAVIDILRKVHSAGELQKQGVPRGMIVKDLRLFGAVGNMAMDHGRRLDAQQSAQLLREAIETDRRNKSGVGDNVRSLEALSVLVADTMGHRG